MLTTLLPCLLRTVGIVNITVLYFCLLYELLPIRPYARSTANNVFKAILICHENKIEIEIRNSCTIRKKRNSNSEMEMVVEENGVEPCRRLR